jgi:hypothetical protein
LLPSALRRRMSLSIAIFGSEVWISGADAQPYSAVVGCCERRQGSWAASFCGGRSVG